MATEKRDPEKLITILPIKALAEEFFPDYGWDKYHMEQGQWPDSITEGELLGMARQKMKEYGQPGSDVLSWGDEASKFAQAHTPEDQACRMRQVVAAALFEVKDIQNQRIGSLAVGGINGLPPDHIASTQFKPEETASALYRQLMYLYSQGLITDSKTLERYAATIAKRTQGKILTCGEIAALLKDVTGQPFRGCRRRDVNEALPKSACPSILCAEGDALANKAVGKMVYLLTAEEGYENVLIMPIARFSSKTQTQRYPLLPAEYTIYYQASGAKGVKTGKVIMDAWSVRELTKGGVQGVDLDLREVRTKLDPHRGQTDIIFRVKPGAARGYWNHHIAYVNPEQAEDRTREYILDPYDFKNSLRNRTLGADDLPPDHNLNFECLSMVTSDIPCPRCTRLILNEHIPTSVVTGPLKLKPDYYEPACLFTLVNSGVTILNRGLVDN